MFILAVLLGVKFREGELVFFCSVLLEPNQVCTVRAGHQLKGGPRSKETYLLHETGFGTLVCDK